MSINGANDLRDLLPRVDRGDAHGLHRPHGGEREREAHRR